MFVTLSKVFLHDAAAMFVKHPERRHGAWARWNPIFETALFAEFENEMREALKQDQEPTDAATLDRLLPGIRERLAGIDETLVTVRTDLKCGFEDVKDVGLIIKH